MFKIRTVLLASLTGLALAACSESPAAQPTAAAATDKAISSDWGLPADASAAAANAGLPMLGQEMLAVHYHAHLDVIVRGQKITVPANLGIDGKQQKIGPLHTHTPDGIVHIESAEDVPFTVGQFFTIWGKALSPTAVGPVMAASGEEVRVYRNGERVSGDFTKLKFNQHDEVVVWLGKSGENPTIPTFYDFPAGS